jgi:hypothetical protein
LTPFKLRRNSAIDLVVSFLRTSSAHSSALSIAASPDAFIDWDIVFFCGRGYEYVTILPLLFTIISFWRLGSECTEWKIKASVSMDQDQLLHFERTHLDEIPLLEPCTRRYVVCHLMKGGGGEHCTYTIAHHYHYRISYHLREVDRVWLAVGLQP